MADESRKEERGKERKTESPPPEGATYRTSKHADIGVGNEEPPKDVREKGGD